MNGFGLNWFGKKRNEPAATADLDLGNIPQHVAIIMDGNGRWAKQRSLPRIAGHRSGMQTVKRITKAANDIGVKVLTLYAFSTENWKRPKDEVDFLMKLPEQFLSNELVELHKNNVQIRMMGRKDGLPEHTLAAVERAERMTGANTGMILNFALNYGSRNEMVSGIRHLAEQIASGQLQPDEITEQLVSECLYTQSSPDPDLLIRTGGEKRISNFMLWQLAYTELAFIDEFWPDFTSEQFIEAIRQYQCRNRRFGAI